MAFYQRTFGSGKAAFPVESHFRRSNEADLSRGIEIYRGFPDPANSLETVYADFEGFFNRAGLPCQGTGAYRIITEQADTGGFESCLILTGADSCTIQAGDTEGIRRALYHLEDLLLGADGPFLPLGPIRRRSWLKSRISRCFFGPIKRPPLNRDELIDEVDYYPDEYLNRLAHEGVNGLWLTVAFRDLSEISFAPVAPEVEKRVEKLRATVRKCLRYGIKTYIFCIEPRAMSASEPLLAAHPVLKGAMAYNGNACFCPFSETAQHYLYEATN